MLVEGDEVKSLYGSRSFVVLLEGNGEERTLYLGRGMGESIVIDGDEGRALQGWGGGIVVGMGGVRKELLNGGMGKGFCSVEGFREKF